jgi:hypothetical protein
MKLHTESYVSRERMSQRCASTLRSCSRVWRGVLPYLVSVCLRMDAAHGVE